MAARGVPDSYLARGEAASLRWRQDFIRSYVEREMPLFADRLSPEPLRRLWGMVAHAQGGLLNAALLARSLGIDVRTVNRYLDLLTELFLLRRLPPWHGNIGKRLTKSPKLYVRDSGILHALLGIRDEETLLGHPVVGASWEGFVVENVVTAAGPNAAAHFYRTAAGAEVDLVLQWPGRRWVVEVKRSLAPRVERGFHNACQDLKPDRAFIVYPGGEQYSLGEGVEAIPLRPLLDLLRQADAG